MNVLVVAAPAVLLIVSALAAYVVARIRRTSGRALAARRSEQPLAHELPYWAFLDEAGMGVAVNVDLTYSTFFHVTGVDVDCLDAEALGQLSVGLHGTLQNLAARTVLQFIHWTDADVSERLGTYARATHGVSRIGKTLVDAKMEDLSGDSTLRRSRLVLSISLPQKSDARIDAALGFVRQFPTFSTEEHVEALRQLRTVSTQVSRGLSASGVKAESLSSDEIRSLSYTFLNPSRAEAVPDPFAAKQPAPHAKLWSSDQSAREQLLYAGIEERRDRLLVDGRLIRVLTLKSLPTCTEPALLETLLVALSFHCRVHFAVELLDSTESLDELKRKRDQAHLLANLREKRNQEAEAQEEDVAELIDKNLRSSVRMVRVALSVVLSVDGTSRNPELTLEKQTAEVLRVLNSLYGAQMMIDELGQLDEFLATLPGNARRGRRWLKCTSENAAHLLPVLQPWTGVDEPLFLVENGRANLVGLDPFDPSLDNPNAFMAGASGAGKSSTTNYLLINLLAAGTRALIIDVGGSYRRVIDLFGGDYFAVELDERSSLNPFFSRADAILPGGKVEERRLQFMMAVVERMVCDHAQPELRHVDRSVLGRAITQTYARITPRTPILSDLVATLREANFEDTEDAGLALSLARSLRVWTEGPAARLVNRPSSIELTTACAAFDLKGLEAHGELQAVVLLILSGMIWNLVMRDQTERKIVVFDEVWRLLESPSSARLIAELYRTSRKYRCSILTISQSVEDFTASSIASALVNNSATVYLLKHRLGHDLVAQQFHLNERERAVFGALEMRRGEYTEALTLYGQHHFLSRIVLSPLEYWIATTHPSDLIAERDLAAKNPGWSRMKLLSALAERFPRGAGSSPHNEVLHAHP